jgi:signal transduction histidine kinase
MATIDLIGSSPKSRALLTEVARITAAPLGNRIYADCFASRTSDSRPAPVGRPRTKVAVQKPFHSTGQRRAVLEDAIRLDERCRERARITRELHDTLLQGFLGASMLLHQAMEQTPADSPSKPALNCALRVVRQAIDEGRAAIRGLQVTLPAASSLEQAFAILLDEVTPARGERLRIFAQGKPRALKPAIQEQLFLIGREAVMNALRHSGATKIEVEIQYLPHLLCLSVRDNGCGMSSEAVVRVKDSHWGLRGMRERAENIGARFDIWSRLRAGTEVCVAVPVDIAMAPA